MYIFHCDFPKTTGINAKYGNFPLCIKLIDHVKLIGAASKCVIVVIC